MTALKDCLRGTAAIEFALAMPMLVALLLGLGDYATLISRTLQVESAAHTAAAYARHHGWDEAAIQSIAAQGLNTLEKAHASVVLQSGCLQADASIRTARHCANGEQPGRYVTVTVTALSTPMLLRSPGLMPDHVAGEALVRIG
jgi:Flp pilus assembly protein TadG